MNKLLQSNCHCLVINETGDQNNNAHQDNAFAKGSIMTAFLQWNSASSAQFGRPLLRFHVIRRRRRFAVPSSGGNLLVSATASKWSIVENGGGLHAKLHNCGVLLLIILGGAIALDHFIINITQWYHLNEHRRQFNDRCYWSFTWNGSLAVAEPLLVMDNGRPNEFA